MKLHTIEELKDMSIEQVEKYYKKLHEENHKIL